MFAEWTANQWWMITEERPYHSEGFAVLSDRWKDGLEKEYYVRWVFSVFLYLLQLQQLTLPHQWSLRRRSQGPTGNLVALGSLVSISDWLSQHRHQHHKSTHLAAIEEQEEEKKNSTTELVVVVPSHQLLPPLEALAPLKEGQEFSTTAFLFIALCRYIYVSLKVHPILIEIQSISCCDLLTLVCIRMP